MVNRWSRLTSTFTRDHVWQTCTTDNHSVAGSFKTLAKCVQFGTVMPSIVISVTFNPAHTSNINYGQDKQPTYVIHEIGV